jgi:hypothetical protein
MTRRNLRGVFGFHCATGSILRLLPNERIRGAEARSPRQPSTAITSDLPKAAALV